LVCHSERRIPLESKQSIKRDSSRKIGAQNDSIPLFSAACKAAEFSARFGTTEGVQYKDLAPPTRFLTPSRSHHRPQSFVLRANLFERHNGNTLSTSV
jgi:hypothetical protein